MTKIGGLQSSVNFAKVNIHAAKGIFMEEECNNIQSVSKLRNYEIFKTEYSPEPYTFKTIVHCGILPLKIE